MDGKIKQKNKNMCITINYNAWPLCIDVLCRDGIVVTDYRKPANLSKRYVLDVCMLHLYVYLGTLTNKQ